MIIHNANQYRDQGKYKIIATNRVKTVEFVHMLEFENRKRTPPRQRMGEIFVQNEVPRVNPKPKSPTPPPVEEKPEELPVEEEQPEEEVEEEESEKEDSDDE